MTGGGYRLDVFDNKGMTFVGYFGPGGIYTAHSLIGCLTWPVWDDQGEALAAFASMPPAFLARYTLRTVKL